MPAAPSDDEPHADQPTPGSTGHHAAHHDVSPRTTPPSTSPLPPLPIAVKNTTSLRGGARSDRHNRARACRRWGQVRPSQWGQIRLTGPALVASRYERASLIVSSNKPFSAWTEIFGDAVAVAVMVDRLVHHAEIINLKGDSYRLKDRRKEVTDQ